MPYNLQTIKTLITIYKTMIYKKFKKISKNLLKFTHKALSLLINGLLWIEGKLVILRFKLDTSKRSQAPISRGSERNPTYNEQEYIGDIYIAEHRKDREQI